MAPSLPGSSGRRAATRGASSSSPSSAKRETRPSRSGRKHHSDSEDQTEDSSSGSRRPTRKASSKSRIRTEQEIETQEERDSESEHEEDEEDEDDDEVGVTDEQEEEEPPEDAEEIEGEIDEAGETKITKDGELLGGRQFKCRSFKLPTRGDRIYMLSMDPARVLGFRDSYLFFLRNPQLVRVNTTVEERQWMIENGMLMANFKSKLIAVVTARSIFKSFGARIIKNGRGRVDDYYEANATEDDPVDESEGDGLSRLGDDHSGANGNNSHDGATSKRKLMHDESTRHITDLNWQYESAMAVRALNSRLKELRKENPKFLDPHTNIEQVPTLLQPSRCEVLPASLVLPTAGLDNQALSSGASTISIPRSIGPQADISVKIEIKGGIPPPPIIHDPNVWAVMPEDIRRILEEAEATRAASEYDNEDLTKYPISILSGQYQAAYPIKVPTTISDGFTAEYGASSPVYSSALVKPISSRYATNRESSTGCGGKSVATTATTATTAITATGSGSGPNSPNPNAASTQ
ncbi:hypothetical protein BGZ76_009016 [Entomortierella beljakovae]|nr:hypothetical protein BGZ76_009016 [Entomortierella beljakovae]